MKLSNIVCDNLMLRKIVSNISVAYIRLALGTTNKCNNISDGYVFIVVIVIFICIVGFALEWQPI